MTLRISLFFFFCIFTLGGCANYFGVKGGHTQALNPFLLSYHHVYKIPPKFPPLNWWDGFNDPQLSQLITIALIDSPDMRIAENRITKAQFLADSALSHLWPTIDFSGSVMRERFSKFGLIPPPFNGRTFNIGQFAFNFNYEFDFWGKHRELLVARLSEECAREADRAQAGLVLAAAVTNTYFNLQSSIALRKNALALWHQRQALLKIVERRALNGIESDVPVQTAVTQAQTARLSIYQYEQAEMLARHQLAALLGKNALNTKIITTKFSYQPHRVFLPECLPANLLAHRPDISVARFRAEAAAHQINVAKALFFPNINLNILFSYQSVGLGHLFDRESQTNAIGGAIDLPIFDAGARRANLGVRYAEYDQAVNEYNRTILIALREVADQQSILSTLKSQLKAQEDVLRATKNNYKIASSRYNHGIVDYTQVLEFKGLVLQQQATLLDLELRQLKAVVGLIKALGGSVTS